MHQNNKQSGSVVLYLLAGISMLATITLFVTQGVKEQRLNRQITENVPMIINDLYKIESIVNRCILMHPEPVDLDGDGDIDAADNPNVPYPVYNDLSTGAAGGMLLTTKCPAAPSADNNLFKNQVGFNLAFLNNGDYELYYINDNTEGVLIRVHRAVGNDDWWTEARARVNQKLSTCKAEVNTTTSPCEVGGGCIHYWVKRLGTSVSVEAGCP